MEELVRNCKQILEFGDYGCFAELTPLSIEIDDVRYAKILFKYTDNREITLCYDMEDIDFADFGIKSHNEYILWSCDERFVEPNIVILVSPNEKTLIEYRDNNKKLLPKNKYFSIQRKIVIDEKLPLSIRLR